MHVRSARWFPAASLLCVGLLFAACGKGQAQDTVNLSRSGPGVTVTVPSFTPISSATPAGTRTPTTAGGTAATGGAATAPAGTIVIVATDNKFDKTEIRIRANEPASITLQNRGSAIHNWHVLNVKDKDGKEITTQLLTGGQSETITFTITQRGTFDYQCDVHPVEMRGKLIVQ
jgi:plastocyanin